MHTAWGFSSMQFTPRCNTPFCMLSLQDDALHMLVCAEVLKAQRLLVQMQEFTKVQPVPGAQPG